jgi:glycosyltransferase involved in cell wall biosynthesis
MHEPLVSVIVPAYNSGPLLDETLASVLDQSWKQREIIVVDDGSTDDTPARLARYGPALRVVRQANQGTGAARNAGIRLARGAYVALLDHDDLWLPTKLEVQVDVARRHPTSGLVACDGEEFEGDQARSRRLLFGPLATRLAAAPAHEVTADAYADLLLGCPISTCGQTLIRREVFERVGLFSECRDESVDYDLWLRIARDLPLTLHGDALVRWRYRPESDSGPSLLRPLRWGLMDLPVLRRHLSSARPEHRAAVRAALKRRAQLAPLAVRQGHEGGMRAARQTLARLASASPRSPGPYLWWLATFAPRWLVARWTGPALELDGARTAPPERP